MPKDKKRKKVLPRTEAEGHVDRFNMEPIGAGRDEKLVCHAFIVDANGNELVDVYTDDPRLEAALIASHVRYAAGTSGPDPVPGKATVRVTYEERGKDQVVLRVDLLSPS